MLQTLGLAPSWEPYELNGQNIYICVYYSENIFIHKITNGFHVQIMMFCPSA